MISASPPAIGARIDENDEQLKFGGGYDHNWVPNKPPNQLEVVARVTERTSGRVLEVLSTQPGVQFYSGNFLDGTITGKGGWVYQRRHGFCLGAAAFPRCHQPSQLPQPSSSSPVKPIATPSFPFFHATLTFASLHHTFSFTFRACGLDCPHGAIRIQQAVL